MSRQTTLQKAAGALSSIRSRSGWGPDTALAVGGSRRSLRHCTLRPATS